MGRRPRLSTASYRTVRAAQRGAATPVAEREVNFRSANSVQRKTFDIATQHPDYIGRKTRGNRLDKVVLDRFRADPEHMIGLAAEIRATIVSGEITSVQDDIDWDDVSAPKGRLTWVKHVRRERSPRLRRSKIAQVKAQGRPVACEVCEFDFERSYGMLGKEFIEVHHVLPLHASGPGKTSLRDLTLLCSNCHRMIHRSSPWLSPDQLSLRGQSAKNGMP